MEKQNRKNTYKLNYVPRGTYAAIAKRLGYTYQYVQMVATGRCRNIKIERLLLQAVRRRIQSEQKINEAIKQLNNQTP